MAKPRPNKRNTAKRRPAADRGGNVRKSITRAKRTGKPAVSNTTRPDEERLQKVLAAGGIASRRECEELILEGRVEVDGEVVMELGTKVNRHKQDIRVDGEPLSKPRIVCFAVNKPTGVVSTSSDPAGRMRVIDLVPPSVGRVFNVGRLDSGSEGLILVTNDGELANLLTHPRHGVEKTYYVTVAGSITGVALNRLLRGEYLAEGFARVANVRVKKRVRNATVLEIVLKEGRNREIRRLLARVGHKVMKLVRVAIGPLRLGDIPSGSARQLKREEISALRRAVEHNQKEMPAERPRSTKRPRAGSAGRGSKTAAPGRGKASSTKATKGRPTKKVPRKTAIKKQTRGKRSR